jgi:type II secretory pathway component PulF
MTAERQLRAERAQQMALIYTVMVCLVSLIVVQFLLLTVALEGYLGGRAGVVSPTALVSGLCFVAACWLIRYILRSGRR